MSVSITLLTSGGVLLGVLLSYLSYKKSGIKDLIKDTKDNAILTTKLEAISQGVNNIQVDIKSHNSKFDSMSERITRVEESAKQCHKRIDKIDDTQIYKREGVS